MLTREATGANFSVFDLIQFGFESLSKIKPILLKKYMNLIE